jgi:hypothetical protein
MPTEKYFLVFKGKKSGMGVTWPLSIEASISYRKHKHKNDMR